MPQKTDKTFGYPTNCWNCQSPLPVFTYACGICGADNTPLDVRRAAKPDPKPSAGRDALREQLARQREAIRKSMKPK